MKKLTRKQLTRKQLKDTRLLDKCTEHWIEMQSSAIKSLEREVVPNSRFCALCIEYTTLGDGNGAKDCEGCPIQEWSSISRCGGTDNPFERAEHWFYRVLNNSCDYNQARWHTASQRMIDYLITIKEWILSRKVAQ